MFTDLFNLCFWGCKNEDIAASLRWAGPQSLQGAVTGLDSTASNFLPSRIQLQNAGTLYQYTCCIQDAPKYTVRPYPKMSGVASGASSSFLYCLHRSKMVALKTEMKSSPCFLEVSLVLLLRSGQRGGGCPRPLCRTPTLKDQEWSHSSDLYKGLYFNGKLHSSAFFFFQSNMLLLLYLLINPLTPSFKGSQKRESWGGYF